jgi:signal transduction histidine kinase
VEDSGEGIDQTLAERLFEPFFTTRSNGTGLGLAIVRRLTEGHGGRISIENGPSGGVVATVRLPIQPSRELAWR